MAAADEELVDYEDEVGDEGTAVAAKADKAKGNYSGVHYSSFKDFLLDPLLLKAIGDCGFEHPSDVQQKCIPQAILGMDVLCQAVSGMGKTAVFVLSCLQQIDAEQPGSVVVLCHARELAFQVAKEFERFSKFMPEIKCSVFYGGVPMKQHRDQLKEAHPHIIVGCPGRILALAREGAMNLKKVKHFILDECDQMLNQLDMRRDVQEIFKKTPHDKQVCMFSATLSKEIRPVCLKFMNNPVEIYVDDEAKLTLHGLQQHYIKLEENEKNRRLNDLLDALEFNQVVIFVNKVARAEALNKLLVECSFPSICIHSGMQQEDRIKRFKAFKDFSKRILVSTNLLGRGIDIARVNIVINYDMPEAEGKGQAVVEEKKRGEHGADAYLHRVGRAGRFGTKGLAISFISSDADSEVLNQVQERFEVNITKLPDQIDVSSYMNA